MALPSVRARIAVLRLLPIAYGLPNEQVKERIVGRGDGAAQTGLFGPLGFTAGQVIRLFEQILRVGHSLRPGGIVQFRLLGQAAEIEVTVNTEFFRVHALPERSGHSAGDLAEV